MPDTGALPRLPAPAARRLLLSGTGLLDDPERPATATRIARTVEGLGFVQVDTIRVVERAHHHILMSRLDGYAAPKLRRLVERDRRLFEHWTHDAAFVPSAWFPLWRHRFAEFRKRWHPTRSRLSRRLGPDPNATVRRARSRIRREGPLRSRDFESDTGSAQGSFWRWTPAKTALEYLWRVGELCITRRDGFEKVYDLTERVLPDWISEPRPSVAEHRAWACRTALAVLGAATPTELAHYLRAVDRLEALRWCRAASRRGEIVPVEILAEDGSAPRAGFAPADWERTLSRLPEPPARLRLLSPFDPLIHDRERTLRLFRFDYRFEGFVPKAKRKHGYFVLPILKGDRLIGRADARYERDVEELVLDPIFWEPGVRETPSLRRGLDEAAARLAEQIRATDGS